MRKERVNGKTVLLVDDDFGVRKTLEFFFKSKGWKVLPAQSGKLGVELSQAEALDLVVLDYRLHDMSGAEVCSQIRQAWDGPIFLVSGWLDAQSQEKVRTAGASRIVHKPFTVNEMNEALEAYFPHA